MSNYEFSVVKFVINIARDEPVNIGLILIDKKNKTLYRRFITNFDELFKRVGVGVINGFEQSFKNYKSVEKNINVDVLDIQYRHQYTSTHYTKPTPIKIKNIKEDFDKLFNVIMSIKD